MSDPVARPLHVFLCHASQDKPAVRELYRRLASEKWIKPWLDEESLLPGQDFDLEIYKATRDADIIIICLSKASVAKEGYVNREIRRALDIAQEKLEGEIYVIPLRFDDCNPAFEQLKKLHWLDYFTPSAHERLLKSLRARAKALKIVIPADEVDSVFQTGAATSATEQLELYRFVRIEQTNSKTSYPFWIGKYPVTNSQYKRFLNAPDFHNPVYWLEFPRFDENCKRIGDWGEEGYNWFHGKPGWWRGPNEANSRILPRHWDSKEVGKSNRYHPVVGISWYEACAYCEWLMQNWNVLLESKAHPSLTPQVARLPLETEWVTAAGGDEPQERYPWDEAGQATTSLKEVLRRANVGESGFSRTSPVNKYPLGMSTLGVMDMAGNVWEWQANYFGQKIGGHQTLSLRGGTWANSWIFASVARRNDYSPDYRGSSVGFRVVIPDFSESIVSTKS